MKQLHDSEETTCPVRLDGYSGDNYHFEMRCEDCDVAYLSRMPLGQVEDRYHEGRITQDMFEAYMHIWAALSPHGGRPEWRPKPTDPNVARIARKMLRRLGR